MPNDRTRLLMLKSKPADPTDMLARIRELLQAKLPEPLPEPEPAPPPVGQPSQSAAPLPRGPLIDYVITNAPRFALDPAAMLAVAEQEGLGGGIGDGGLAYGPWQDHMTEFAGRPWFGAGRNNQQVQAWAWSPAGIEYVMRQMVIAGAAGLSGVSAISTIVHGYERPKEPIGEIQRASARYSVWRNAL
jgi:hypothetical protein